MQGKSNTRDGNDQKTSKNDEKVPIRQKGAATTMRGTQSKHNKREKRNLFLLFFSFVPKTKKDKKPNALLCTASHKPIVSEVIIP